MYALKKKGKLEFSGSFKTIAELDEFINASFYKWKGCQERGSNKTLDDYMLRNERVKLTIERI